MNAREFTFHLLLKNHRNHAYSNLLLDKELEKGALNAKENAFATVLFYGVLEKQITLDYELSLYLKQPLKKLRPEVLIALRIGAYQLLFMSKIPPSAAINESVNLVKRNHCTFAAGLVNAVLRKVLAAGLVLPTKGSELYLSVRYSVPQSLITLWQNDYGAENCLGILDALESPPVCAIRVNTFLTDAKALYEKLSNEGLNVRFCAQDENCLLLDKCGSVSSLSAFRDGLFHVEDIAAQKAALLLGAQTGERILDCCAAPGGKAFTIAQQMKSGEIVACDIHPSRVGLIESGAKRLHIPFIHAFCHDATKFNEQIGLFDRVICDVPCSGLGIIRKKPEIRYKSDAEIAALVPTQLQILATSFRYLKPGGILVYSTCTLHKAENEDVVKAFAAEKTDCEILQMKTFFPHIDNTDGFFAAVIMKK